MAPVTIDARSLRSQAATSATSAGAAIRPSGMVDAPGAAPRVLVVDDEPLVRQGLRLILDSEPDLVLVGEGATAPRP